MIIAKGFRRLLTKGLAGVPCRPDSIFAEPLKMAIDSEDPLSAQVEAAAGISATMEPVDVVSTVISEVEEIGSFVEPTDMISGDPGCAPQIIMEGEDVGGWIYIGDVTVPGGSASGKVWQDSGQTVLQEVTVSSLDVEVSVRASYPLVEVDGNASTLSRDAGGGFYSGAVPVTLTAAGTFQARVDSPDDDPGPYDTCTVALDAPPTVTALAFTGGYPGSQTELKEDDGFDIAITADKQFDRVRVLDFGACKLDETPVAATTSTIVSGVIDDEGDTAAARPARVQVRDATTGAWSSTRDTNQDGGTTDGVDLVTCNNLHPSASWGSPSYPGAQQALKNTEQATITLTASDYDTIPVDSPNGQLTIIDSSPPSIAVERLAGDYNVSTNNLRASANRAANDATTIAQTVVRIAHVAAEVSVAEPAARLRSGGNDGTSAQSHTITATANQLLSAFDMDEDTGGGTFLSSWAGSPPDATWTRSLQVHDDDTPGDYTWQNLSATNLAGIVTTSITGDDGYTIGGFVARDVTWQAFQQISDGLNCYVSDYSKLTAGSFSATGQDSTRHTPQGDHADAADEYTVDTVPSANPFTVWWNDVSAASSNTGEAYLFSLEEEV